MDNKPDKPRMTEKQKRFCDYYIEIGNAAEAAVRAGYSKKTAKEIGCENLTKPHLKAYIDERLEKMENERIANAQEVLEHLTSIMRGEEVDGVYKVKQTNNEGEIFHSEKEYQYTPNVEERTKAAELLGKRYSLFTDKVDIQMSDIVVKVGEWDAEDE